jgi:hypothetical protein
MVNNIPSPDVFLAATGIHPPPRDKLGEESRNSDMPGVDPGFA